MYPKTRQATFPRRWRLAAFALAMLGICLAIGGGQIHPWTRANADVVDGTITVKKVNIGGDQDDEFTMHLDQGANFTVSASGPSVTIPASAGQHIVYENTVNLYGPYGYSLVDASSGDFDC